MSIYCQIQLGSIEKHSYVSGENVLLFFLRTMSSSTNSAKSVKILAFHH